MTIRVASFVSPLNQFSEGYKDECVAYGIADIYFCGPPSGKPAGSAQDITALADKWYKAETGALASTAGLTLAQAEHILTSLGLSFKVLPNTIDALKQALSNEKNPVLVTAPESSFFDIGLGRVPYAWNYTQYNHCIVASGVSASGNLLVRDYANVETTPGAEREYDISKIRPISLIAVIPRWKKNQPFTFSTEEIQEWIELDRSIPQNTGLMESWAKARRAGYFLGSPTSWEHKGIFQGKPAILQSYQFAFGVDIEGQHTWHEARGYVWRG